MEYSSPWTAVRLQLEQCTCAKAHPSIILISAFLCLCVCNFGDMRSQVTCEPRPSCYNDAILKKFFGFLNSIQLSRHQHGRSEEEKGLCCVGSFATVRRKLWHSENGLWGFGNGLWLANCYQLRKAYCCLPQDVL